MKKVGQSVVVHTSVSIVDETLIMGHEHVLSSY